jgi:predicted nuclease of restriction endonuclease-like RecB superfamily
MSGKLCDICGTPSGMYPLCTKCFKLKDENKVSKCDKCGKWYLIEKGCNCRTTKKPEEEKKKFKFSFKKEETPYTKKAIIHKENDINNIDVRKKWEAMHQCDDGHYVRSYSEVIIDNWLYNNGYVHAYEKSVFMPKNPEETVISDFYLPQGNVYIEFWGLSDDKYLNRKDVKIKLYEQNNINLINLTEEDIKRLNDILPRLIYKFINKI